MRILYVCADPGVPVRGAKGAAVHMREITAAMSRAGHQVTLAAVAEGAGNPPPAIHRIEWLSRTPDLAATHLAGLIASERIEFVIERYSLQSGAARVAADRHGLPLLLEVNAPLVHEAARYRGLSDVAGAAEKEREVFESADAIQVVSGALERYVRSRSPSARVRVIPNGVDYARFAAAEPARLAGADCPVIGFAGSMKAWHGIPELLEAFALIAGRPRDAVLVLAGAGPQEEIVQRRVSQRDLTDRVVLTGAVPHAQVPALVHGFDIAAAPYAHSEDFYFSPLKVLEYMAAGRPVVYPELGELPLLVADGGLGYPAGDVEALAERLERLIDDGSLRWRLGRAGAARAQRHDWKHVAVDLVSLATQTRPRRPPARPPRATPI